MKQLGSGDHDRYEMFDFETSCIVVLLCGVLTPACNDNATVESDPSLSTAAGAGGVAGAAALASGGTAALAGSSGGTVGAAAQASSGGAGSLALGGSGGASGGASAGADLGGAAGSSGSSSVSDPGNEGDGEREIGPIYHDAAELQQRAVPRGQWLEFEMKSSQSVIYPGNAPKTGAYTRKVWVYVPAQYERGKPAATIVVQDGDGFGFKDLLTRALDNMIAAGELPVIVPVFANSGGGDYLQSQRGVEYDTVSGTYAEWVDTELLPRAEQETSQQRPEQAVTFTKDPEGRAALGGSSGGAAAFSMAWWRPDLFRRVITFSGTYVDQEWPEVTDRPYGAWHYHEDRDLDDGGLIAKEPLTKPIRVWLASAANDLGAGGPASTHRNFDLANQRMALKLRGRGYHVHYDHALAAGHVDPKVTAQTLPEALRWLWRGYPID